VGALEQFAEAVRSARHCVVLTGAGASTESGLPDFRSKEGLWQGIDPTQLVSVTALRNNPVQFYQFYQMRLSRLREAEPNRTHVAIARLEKMGRVRAVITQNIDGLHQAAGSQRVIEAHGSLRVARCLDCDREYPVELIEIPVLTPADLPRCEYCRGVVKPGVTLFEEPLPAEAVEDALSESRLADLMIVVGSSLAVYPVNMLPRIALNHGARLAIVNLESTQYDRHAHWVFHEKAGELLMQLAERVGS
jgi:NAD-dependent deacetylase